MQKISSANQTEPNPKRPPNLPRVPQPFENIKVNHCKNPRCANFCRPSSHLPQSRGRYANPDRQDGYIACNSKGVPSLRCKQCGEVFPIKSNMGIYEEFKRLTSYPNIDEVIACRTEECPNKGKGVYDNPELYKKSGTTKAGSQRYFCKQCKRTLSVPKRSISRQRKSHLNGIFFRALMNKTPLRGISEICDIGMLTGSRKINFIYEQCCRFIEARESRLFKGKSLRFSEAL